MATYGWIIDEDHLWEPNDNFRPAVGVTGPHSAPDDIIEKLETDSSFGRKFRMFDDDENLVFSGRYDGTEDEDSLFGPLMDYGMPDSGCTEIHYYNSETGAFCQL